MTASRSARAKASPRCAVVAIGRNEGPRLEACLTSISAARIHAVYVDSGSTDDSVAIAGRLGAKVVRLDMSTKFTAARARNAGFFALEGEEALPEFVQFVDGDCVLADGWMEAATAFLDAHPDVAVVCGRRRERRPEASVYNELCDMEWNTPVGEALECGGDALFRVSAFKDVGGYSADLIAGEEPELCVRLRASGWRIWRLDHEMTLHDAGMTRFRQWWRRSMRAGYAFAEVARRHRHSRFGIWRPAVRRALLWGAAGPTLLVIGALAHPAAFAGALAYPAQVCRLAGRHRGERKASWRYALFATASKFPEAQGVATFYVDLLRGKTRGLIEYR